VVCQAFDYDMDLSTSACVAEVNIVVTGLTPEEFATCQGLIRAHINEKGLTCS
jgi:hypothetical protein